jgi:uncharacterized protein YecE (DUF72 family)
MTAGLRVGTSAFTASGWETAFYPAGMKPAEYLSYYATKFDTVEVDSTFYRAPSAATVRGWYNKTPKDFVFALKVPQLITHEKCLDDCDAEFNEFVAAADLLGEKLGVLLLQFGYFNKSAFPGVDEFLGRLVPFLKKLPSGHRFALEIRNKNWMVPKFVEALRERGVGLALIDQSWVPRPWELKLKTDLVTADGFTYVRLLGDRKGIEEQTKVWDKVVVNRQAEMRSWTDYLRPLKQRGVTIFVYVNNHYSGFGPATVEAFLEIWDAKK